MENETIYHNINDLCGYSPKQLFITPKYKGLKDEIINNDIYSLSCGQLNISIRKTNKLINTLKSKSIRYTAKNDHLYYDISVWSALRYSHLLALVLYSDWTELQCEFTKTWRKTDKYQTLKQIKDKNREFYHWSKNIRESVEYYGNLGWNKNYDYK